MPPAFKTKKGAPSVEITGIGVCEEDGQNGVPLDRAARRMPELQNDQREPLTGKALTDAAKAWADTVDLTVANQGEETPDPETPAPTPSGQEN